MRKDPFEYRDGSIVCEGYIAHEAGKKRPGVLVVHQWSGISDHEKSAVDRLAGLGYTAIAVDVYGRGVRGKMGEDNSALIGPWLQNRAGLKQRLLAAVNAAKAHEAVDGSRIAMIGYCFGGLCVLDVARSGTSDVKGVVSLHGLFGQPNIGPQAPIKAKVLALHGWDDPLAKPEDVLMLAKEMTEAKADWQLHAYGHTTHAFTSVGREGYSESADKRSWEATLDFLKEVLA